MSDAIVLDVADTTPVRLDVGDADPIAREEIAELTERVEAIEADYVTSENVMGALGGEAPALVSGSSRAVLGDVETASWMQRTTAADGARGVCRCLADAVEHVADQPCVTARL